MPNEHPKVPPTKENFEEDHQDKLKLNDEFAAFKKLVEQAAKTSPDVEKLVAPLKKLENAVIVAAHGKYFVINDHKKPK